MASYQAMVLTKVNAARVLGWNTKDIFSVKLSANGEDADVVHVEGYREVIDRKTLMLSFVKSRQEKAQRLIAVQDKDCPAVFYSQSESGNGNYRIMLSRDGAHCVCHDYGNQLEAFGYGVCGHGYAVLKSIGFDSLKSYRAAWKKGGSLAEIINMNSKKAA